MIYCVEDDAGILEMELYALRSAGFEAEGFPDAASFRQAFKNRPAELVLLDIMLPDEDGISVLRSLRRDPQTAEIPVIMATAKGTEMDKVIGLDSGADDYLAKPFGMLEMLSRIRAVLRRTSAKKDSVLTFGEIAMNTAEHTVRVGGTGVELSLKEYELLKLFLMHPEKVYTRDELFSLVWGGSFVGETRTVDVHIANLRTKLGNSGALIHTVRGACHNARGRFDGRTHDLPRTSG